MRQSTSVLGFIYEQRAKKTSDKQILHTLLSAGWPMDIILRAMEHKPLEKIMNEKQTKAQRSKIYHFARTW